MRALRKICFGVNWIVAAGLVVQVYFGGVVVFGGPPAFHALLGWIVILLALLAAVLAAVVFRRHAVTWWSLALVASVILQPVLVFVLSSVSIYLVALHPLNGVFGLWLSILIAVRSGREMRPGTGVRSIEPESVDD